MRAFFKKKSFFIVYNNAFQHYGNRNQKVDNLLQLASSKTENKNLYFLIGKSFHFLITVDVDKHYTIDNSVTQFYFILFLFITFLNKGI